MQPAGRRRSAATSYKPFHATTGKPQCHRTIKLKAARRRPAVLTAAEAQPILDACEHLRDRLLFATLLDTGCGPGTGPGRTGPEVSPADRLAAGPAVGTERSPFAQVRRRPARDTGARAGVRPRSGQRKQDPFGHPGPRRRVTPGRDYLTRYKSSYVTYPPGTRGHPGTPGTRVGGRRGGRGRRRGASGGSRSRPGRGGRTPSGRGRGGRVTRE